MSPRAQKAPAAVEGTEHASEGLPPTRKLPRPTGSQTTKAKVAAKRRKDAAAKRAAAKEANRAPRISVLKHEELMLAVSNERNAALKQRNDALALVAPLTARVAQLEKYIIERIIPAPGVSMAMDGTSESRIALATGK